MKWLIIAFAIALSGCYMHTEPKDDYIYGKGYSSDHDKDDSIYGISPP